MKYILSLLFVVVFATGCLGSYSVKCRVPSCKKCVTTTPEPCYADHYVEEEIHHEYCGVPECNKCVTTTTYKPDCVEHYVEEEVDHDDCEVTTTAKPNCEHTYEEEHCPHGYFWNGYFCVPYCKCASRKPLCY
uniref:TIL domain-containing protein n=1 Tax=Anopheles maculatus TaxID=74869 RepID=A0A182SIP6_9DIPT